MGIKHRSTKHRGSILYASEWNEEHDNDMRGERLINLGKPIKPTDALRLQEFLEHKSAIPIDHPDGSITDAKIKSVSRSKIPDFFSPPFWSNIPDKPDKFPPEPHKHDVSDIEGLQVVSDWKDIQNKPIDLVDNAIVPTDNYDLGSNDKPFNNIVLSGTLKKTNTLLLEEIDPSTPTPFQPDKECSVVLYIKITSDIKFRINLRFQVDLSPDGQTWFEKVIEFRRRIVLREETFAFTIYVPSAWYVRWTTYNCKIVSIIKQYI